VKTRRVDRFLIFGDLCELCVHRSEYNIIHQISR
jgi:acetyl-CoA acyltransferase